MTKSQLKKKVLLLCYEARELTSAFNRARNLFQNSLQDRRIFLRILYFLLVVLQASFKTNENQRRLKV